MERKASDSAHIFQLLFDVSCEILNSKSINVLDEKLVECFNQAQKRGVYFVDEVQNVEWGAI